MGPRAALCLVAPSKVYKEGHERVHGMEEARREAFGASIRWTELWRWRRMRRRPNGSRKTADVTIDGTLKKKIHGPVMICSIYSRLLTGLVQRFGLAEVCALILANIRGSQQQGFIQLNMHVSRCGSSWKNWPSGYALLALGMNAPLSMSARHGLTVVVSARHRPSALPVPMPCSR